MARTRQELKEYGKKTKFSKENQPAKNGRKKKLPALDVLLADVLGGENEDDSEAKAVLESLVKEAKKGNVQAAVAVLNRAYGMPKQPVEHGGDSEAPILLKIKEATDEQLEFLTSLDKK